MVTELGKEKQAVAVALSLSEGDKRTIMKRVSHELELGVLNSLNGMSVLFEYLDRYWMEDELMNRIHWKIFRNLRRNMVRTLENILLILI